MKRALGLLLILVGLAGAAAGWINAAKHDCRSLKREVVVATAAMEVCSQSMGCHFEYQDLKSLARQQVALKQCEAEQ